MDQSPSRPPAGRPPPDTPLDQHAPLEAELRASEEHFRLLVGSVRDYAIFMLDPQGQVRSWNEGAQAIKGYAAAEIVGQHFSRFYTPQDREAGWPARNLAQAREQGRVEDEGWRLRKDGTLFWANVVITAVRDGQGVLIGFAKITRDMSERRRLEELERSSRRMNEFLAMLAHELRNPLAPIRNAVSLMQLEPLPSPALRKSRDVIDRQLTHITRLVDDLLDVGRLTTGKIRLRKEFVRASDLVARSVEAARPQIEARRHRLHVELPPPAVFLHCDPTRISQVIQNLLVNAAKYTPEGGQVGVKAEAGGGFLSVAVRDDGQGVARDDLERIFELFVQGEDKSPSDSGLGIGLTLARSLVELHGGRLDAESAGPGQGSTFTFRLPVADVPPDEPEAGPAPPAAGGLRVLVVDDNRDSADSTTALLAMLGHEAACAYGGEAALQVAPPFRPDVALLDRKRLAIPSCDAKPC